MLKIFNQNVMDVRLECNKSFEDYQSPKLIIIEEITIDSGSTGIPEGTNGVLADS